MTNSLAFSVKESFFSVAGILLTKNVAGIRGGPSGPVNSWWVLTEVFS